MMELLLKASLAIGLAFLFYKLLLQQESFFTVNRLYLLGCIILAFVLPYISLPPLISQQGYLTSFFEEHTVIKQEPVAAADSGITVPIVGQKEEPKRQLQPQFGKEAVFTTQQANAVEEKGFKLAFWLLMLYFFGLTIFLLSLLFQLGMILYKIRRTSDKIQDGACVIVNTKSRQAPCSFFNYIFIYPDDYDFETYEQIIAHEKIHARFGHSIDLLLAEIAVILLWFNPLIWMLKKEIEKNNEYQADAQLLESKQVRKDQYQLNLLQIAVPNKPLSITTNYNQSLLKQRIMMMNAKRSTPQAYWKYAFMLPLFFGMLLLMNKPANSHVGETISISLLNVPAAAPQEQGGKGKTAVVGKENDRSFRLIGGQTDMSEGYWYGHREDGRYCLEFKGRKDASSWNMSRCFAAGLFQKQSEGVFVMQKESGMLRLNGNLEAEVSQGTYVFSPDAAFQKFLADNDISSKDKNLLFHLFFADVDRAYVSLLKKHYGRLEGEQLLELAIHDINRESFESYLALFQKYSNKKPSLQEIIEARIHDIDQAYIEEMQASGFKNESLEQLMEASIHGVDAAYAASLQQAGFPDLNLAKVVEAKIHGITPEVIEELQGLGFGNLSLEKMMELKIHGVNAAFIKDMQAAGYNDLSLEEYLEAKIHDLNAAAIQEIKALGYNNLTFEDMVSAKIHDVNAAYVADLKKAGFSDLSMEETVEARIHGIDSKFIEQARKEGYDLSSLDQYIELKIHGMAMKSLKKKNKE